MREQKVLMVAFHYPPQCVGSGVQRTVNFVRHLPEFGWQPTVLSAQESAYEVSCDDFLPEEKVDERVVRAMALDAARHLGIARRYPRFLALPDRWSSWWLDGVRTGKRLLREGKFDAIWSTQPIPTAHMIAASLARSSGLPWIADFRDPIINRMPPNDPLLLRAWKWVENKAVEQASRCVFTTESMADLYRERYPQLAEKFVVICNGYDEAVFERAVPERDELTGDTLLLLHSGQIYPAERDPSTLFQAVRRLIDHNVLAEDRICLRFRASGCDLLLQKLARQYGVAKVLDLAKALPYQKAINEVLAADVLLLLQGKAFNTQVPAKTYEYLRAGKQILALLDHAGDTAALLRGFSSPLCADMENVGEIAERIAYLSQQLAAPETLARLAVDREAAEKYSRRQQTAELARQLTVFSAERE